MKQNITALAITLTLGWFTPLLAQEETPNPKNFELEITKHTTEKEIKDIQQDLERRQITLEFEELKYSISGKLRKVRGTIKFKDGAFGTFFSERLTYVKITRIYNRSGQAGNIKIDVK